MAKLSVNVNKIATLRNSRGGNSPDLLQVVKDCESFGSQGITIHPRPDQRHIRYSDAYNINKIYSTEFNIEGNPIDKFMDMVLQIKPTQVTLVPDDENAITSNAGWDTLKNEHFLSEIIAELKKNSIRTSIFIEPHTTHVEGAAKVSTDRIELYTEPYATNYAKGNKKFIDPYIESAELANAMGLGVNAGHDLNLSNIAYFAENIPNLLEVSIGHALISEALYLGLENTIQMYLSRLKV